MSVKRAILGIYLTATVSARSVRKCFQTANPAIRTLTRAMNARLDMRKTILASALSALLVITASISAVNSSVSHAAGLDLIVRPARVARARNVNQGKFVFTTPRVEGIIARVVRSF